MIADSIDFFSEKILAVFQNDDPEIFGLAAWAMGQVGFNQAQPFLKLLKERIEPVRIYIEGDFQEKPLGQWAEEAIKKISESV